MFALSSEHTVDSCCHELKIVPVQCVDDIDLIKGKEILVDAFMTAYEDVPLVELNPNFTCIADVKRFYEACFASELEHYKHGGLIWVQAFDGDALVGWATFELETTEPDAAYMNLLVVDPKEQGRGIGKLLTFSIRSEELFPNIQAINLLIRKINVEGKKFYEHIGFADHDYISYSNFVDMSLLSGLRWTAQQ
jgi:GNAT superfamily N-acetyltransferase